MIPVCVRLYLGSETRLAFLEKEVEFVSMPRMGEWLKLKNDKMGDYFAFRIQEVTHREGRTPDIMLELPLGSEGRPEFSGREEELDEYVQSYVREGWGCSALLRKKLGTGGNS